MPLQVQKLVRSKQSFRGNMPLIVEKKALCYDILINLVKLLVRAITAESFEIYSKKFSDIRHRDDMS